MVQKFYMEFNIMVLQLVADHKIKIYKLFDHENLLHNYRHDIKHDTELP